jgi:hypothetical protein
MIPVLNYIQKLQCYYGVTYSVHFELVYYTNY